MVPKSGYGGGRGYLFFMGPKFFLKVLYIYVWDPKLKIIMENIYMVVWDPKAFFRKNGIKIKVGNQWIVPPPDGTYVFLRTPPRIST